jgi:hypothetical protein
VSPKPLYFPLTEPSLGFEARARINAIFMRATAGMLRRTDKTSSIWLPVALLSDEN